MSSMTAESSRKEQDNTGGVVLEEGKLIVQEVTVSAPGKILLAGGYLVLESPQVGLVVAVDKRFYTTVRCTRRTSAPSAGSITTTLLPIAVYSPQFGQSWHYVFHRERCTLTAVPGPSDPASSSTPTVSKNPFIEKTLRVGLTYLLRPSTTTTSSSSSEDVMGLELTIQADNDFYSLVPHLNERQWDRSLSSALQLPPFLPARQDPQTGQVYKTGLGSSACLVTSVLGCLCQTFGQAQDLYNLAQLCHCYAQGKVGSGFDVAAACYGSHVYQRFPPAVLAPVLAQLDHREEPPLSPGNEEEDLPSEDLLPLLVETIQSTWPGGVMAPLPLGNLLQVTMADVSGGSESPSMARTVLAWREAQQQAASAAASNGHHAEDRASVPVPHWDDLKLINQSLVDLMAALHQISVSDEEREALAAVPASAWDQECYGPAGRLLFQLSQALQQSRYHFKAMGQAAGVPIEPDEQTALADATMAVPGVVAALVPGAGGYDALACLYVAHDRVRQDIGRVWATWPPAQVCPLTVQAGQDGDGWRVEPHPPTLPM